MNQFLIRIFDVFSTTLGLLILSPILLIISLVLKFSGEGEIFYKQARVGRGKKQFFIYKFATMVKDSPSIGSGELTEYNDPRVLPVGKLLRKTKLNELPQLFNVFLGDMSLIGPRPQTQRYFSLFSHRSRELISQVRPGVTGIGSLLFRDEEEIFRKSSNAVLLDDTVITPYKGELEQWYISNQSFYLYLKVLLLTIYAVIYPRYFQPGKYFDGLPDMPLELSKIINSHENHLEKGPE
jgi:lipopolysaccharide/colanic/teichoic acid biosynthesis glycosyltransferase